eukprot:gene14862-31551_t
MPDRALAGEANPLGGERVEGRGAHHRVAGDRQAVGPELVERDQEDVHATDANARVGCVPGGRSDAADGGEDLRHAGVHEPDPAGVRVADRDRGDGLVATGDRADHGGGALVVPDVDPSVLDLGALQLAEQAPAERAAGAPVHGDLLGVGLGIAGRGGVGGHRVLNLRVQVVFGGFAPGARSLCGVRRALCVAVAALCVAVGVVVPLHAPTASADLPEVQPCVAQPVLGRESYGSGVLCLQFALIMQGYSVPYNGLYSPETEDAVRWYQATHPPLVVNGVAGEETLVSLGIAGKAAIFVPAGSLGAAPVEASSEAAVGG